MKKKEKKKRRKKRKKKKRASPKVFKFPSSPSVTILYYLLTPRNPLKCKVAYPREAEQYTPPWTLFDVSYYACGLSLSSARATNDCKRLAQRHSLQLETRRRNYVRARLRL